MKHPSKRIRTDKGLKLLERARKISMKLPETVEAIDGFGHTSFRVNNKPFIIMGETDEGVSITIKVEFATQSELIRTEEFHRAHYIGQHGWISKEKKAKADWKQLGKLIQEGYRRTAPKRILKELDV